MVTDCAPGDVTCGGPSIDCDAHPDAPGCDIVTIVPIRQEPVLQHFKIFDLNGNYLGVISGYNKVDAANVVTSKLHTRVILINK
jgi:hypothetical protein